MPALRANVERLRVPAVLSGATAGALAGLYIAIGIDLPPGSLSPLLAAIALAVLPVAILVSWRATRRAPTLRRLARSTASVSRDELRAVVREAGVLPDAIFAAVLQHWSALAVLLALGLWLLEPEARGSAAMRVMGATLACGPMAAMLASLLATLRCREVIRAAAGRGLTLAEIHEAIPRRLQLSIRLVLFVGVVVITPALMTADLSQTIARRGLEQVVESQEPGAPADADVVQALLTNATVSMLAFLSLVFAIALSTAYLAGNALRQPLEEIADGARRIAEGKLDSPSTIPAEDEVWEVSAAFSTLQAQLADLLTRLRGAGVQIGATTEQMASSSVRYQERATSQANALSQTSATTEELARSARHISESAEAVSQIAQDTFDAAQAGKQSADAFGQRMGQMRQLNREIAGRVQRLNQRVIQIGGMVRLINAAADKSDLLALSAELESTKAGGVGQGFSLVAGEVRRLGENMLKSTQEIEKLIEEVRGASSAAVAATEGAVRATENGNALAGQISERLGAIVAIAGQTATAVQSISFASQQQEQGTDQVVSSMADILRITEESLAATRQIASANRELSSVTRELKGVVERFDLREGV
jgi:methyl-accepting chemotaxis protein